MTSILDDLKADVSATLVGTLRPAVLWKYTQVPDGYGGYEFTYNTPYTCEGVRGSFESVLAGLSGIPRTHSKIELLADTLAVTPERLDKIAIEGWWFLIENIEVDPAGAVWVCECSATGAVS